MKSWCARNQARSIKQVFTRRSKNEEDTVVQQTTKRQRSLQWSRSMSRYESLWDISLKMKYWWPQNQPRLYQVGLHKEEQKWRGYRSAANNKKGAFNGVIWIFVWSGSSPWGSKMKRILYCSKQQNNEGAFNRVVWYLEIYICGISFWKWNLSEANDKKMKEPSRKSFDI